MIDLHDWTWPHLVDIRQEKCHRQSKPFSMSRAVPESTNPTPSQIEQFDGPGGTKCILKQEALPKVTFTTCSAQVAASSTGSVQSPTMSGALAGPAKSVTFTDREQEALYRPYARLPTPPNDSGEDIGLDINPHLSPDPKSVDSSGCAQRKDEILPSLPNTPLALAQFGFISRESFDTSVRDLIQEGPDSPIGGYPAAKMTPQKTIGTSAILRRSNNSGRVAGSELPPLNITCPTHGSVEFYLKSKRPPMPKTNFSDPFVGTITKGKERQKATNSSSGAENSGYTTVMVTASETPIRREGGTDLSKSNDGPRASGPVNNANGPLGEHTLADCAVSPKNSSFDASDLLGPNSVLAFQAGPSATQGKSNFAKFGNIPVTGKGAGAPGIGTVDFAVPGRVMTGIQVNIPGLGIKTVNVPTVGLSGTTPIIPGVPTETVNLPPPPTPMPNRKPALVRRAVRKGRKVVLRRRVLTIIIGRELAGPTKQALDLISRGQPVNPDVQGIMEASGLPGPAPPPVAAPM